MIQKLKHLRSFVSLDDSGVVHKPFLASSESENSGSTFVTPQQRRRRPVHPHHRKDRKISAPPELQAHLGYQKPLRTINFPFIVPQSGSPNLDAPENSSATEVIINFPNSSKLGESRAFCLEFL